MKLKHFAMVVCAVAVAGAAACSKDVTASGSGTPAAIVASRSLTNQAVGSKFSITAYTIDENAQRMAGALSATPANTAVLAVDSTIYVHELLETRFFLRAVTASPAAGTALTVTGNGLTTNVTVKIQ